MNINGKTNSANIKIDSLLNLYLNNRTDDKNFENYGDHLDEDTLTAFVEGNISKREAHPVVNHLIKCTFCRHITAELARLDSAFGESESAVIINENQPSKVSDVLNGILAKIFGLNEGAVFAHHEEDDKNKETSDENKDVNDK